MSGTPRLTRIRKIGPFDLPSPNDGRGGDHPQPVPNNDLDLCPAVDTAGAPQLDAHRGITHAEPVLLGAARYEQLCRLGTAEMCRSYAHAAMRNVCPPTPSRTELGHLRVGLHASRADSEACRFGVIRVILSSAGLVGWLMFIVVLFIRGAADARPPGRRVSSTGGVGRGCAARGGRGGGRGTGGSG
jgi:hypothetical protein